MLVLTHTQARQIADGAAGDEAYPEVRAVRPQPKAESGVEAEEGQG